MQNNVTRRSFLRTSLIGAGALALPWGCAPLRRPDFSIAFLTDMHVDHRRGAPEGWASALQHVQNSPARPEMIVTGGDLAYDCLHTGLDEANAQYDLFDRALEEVDIPVHHVMGNHDCLGVYDDSPMSPGDELFGKAYFLQRFKRERTYTSFDHGGWHFVLLDTVGIEGRNYHGYVDGEQLAWLDEDLAGADRPTVVFGHIPLFSNLPEWQEGIENPDHPKAVVNNSPEVVEILGKHPVKLVMAGHLHINESWLFRGVEYANVGAVSGSWWRGDRHGFQEGYALLEFYRDQVVWSYVDYGWTVPAGVETEEHA